jgi:O-antigen ligase
VAGSAAHTLARPPFALPNMATTTTLSARTQIPVPGSRVPIVMGGLLAAFLVGVALAINVVLGLGFLIGLLYVPLVMLNLPLGVACWVPLVFLERIPLVSLGPTAVSVLVGLAWLGVLTYRRQQVMAVLRRSSGLFFLLAFLVAWVTLSLVWAVDPSAAVREFWAWWVSAAILTVVATSLSTPRHLTLICAAFVVGALISVVAGFVPGAAVVSDAGSDASRLGGSYGDPNYLAAGLVPAVALVAGLAAVFKSPGQRALLLGAAAVLAIGLVATGSRGGIVAAAVAGLMAVLLARGKRLSILAMLATGVAIAGVWIVASSSGNWDRIREFDTGTGRVDLWTIALRIGEAKPLGGVGLAGFQENSDRYLRQPGRLPSGNLGAQLVLDQPHVAHNTYLQMFAETGIIGLALLIGVILAALKATWAAARTFERSGDFRFAALTRAVLIAQVAVLIASVFLSNANDRRTWILLGLGPAALAIASRSSARSL